MAKPKQAENPKSEGCINALKDALAYAERDGAESVVVFVGSSDGLRVFLKGKIAEHIGRVVQKVGNPNGPGRKAKHPVVQGFDAGFASTADFDFSDLENLDLGDLANKLKDAVDAGQFPGGSSPVSIDEFLSKFKTPPAGED